MPPQPTAAVSAELAVTSARTMLAPSTSERSFAWATRRGRLMSPQSVESPSRSGGIDLQAGPDAVGDLVGLLDLDRLHVDDTGDEVLLPAVLLQGLQVAGAPVGDLVVEGGHVAAVGPGEDGVGPGGAGVALPQADDVLRAVLVGGLPAWAGPAGR